MVKKTKKAAEEPQTGGWGAMSHAEQPPFPETPEGEAPQRDISDNPENRQPPMDAGWDEGERPPMGMPPADPAPAEPAKTKGKSRKKDKPEEKPADVPTAQGNVNRDHNGGEAGRLTSYVERLERLAEEKKTIADDMKEVMAEAKAEGYDTATLRKVMQRRKLGKEACDEMDAILDLYEQQVGFD